MTSEPTGRPRRRDPGRRERIARAALAVVARVGVEGLTHRAVAAEAAVPLGSTTYHFATLDDLLGVALTLAADDGVTAVRAWAGALPVGTDLVDALTDLVLTHLHAQRAETVVQYDLYVAALRRPRLRATATAWDEALAEVFSARTDPVTGRVLASLFCGLLMQAVLSDPPPGRDEVRALFARVLGQRVSRRAGDGSPVHHPRRPSTSDFGS